MNDVCIREQETTETVTNINIHNVCGKSLQRKLRKYTAFIRHGENAEQTNLSHEIKNEASVALRIAVDFILFIARALWIRMYNRKASELCQTEKSDNGVRKVASVSPSRDKVINYFTKSGEYRWQPDNCFSAGDCRISEFFHLRWKIYFVRNIPPLVSGIVPMIVRNVLLSLP